MPRFFRLRRLYRKEHMFYNIPEVKYMEYGLQGLRAVDVICQHSKDGEIIPIRVRLTDEDGQRQAYTIKEYKDLSHQGTRTMPDGIYVTDKSVIFECRISVFDRLRMIRLYYDPESMVWRMTG